MILFPVDTLIPEIILGVIGLVGMYRFAISLSMAVREEHPQNGERQVRLGYRLAVGPMFAMFLLDYTAIQLTNVPHLAFVAYVFLFLAFGFLVLIPLRVRIARTRAANGWAPWPGKLII
ncbi:MAG: hypothetical protein Q8S43_04280 [Actinomycetota bacterium]|nr:MAG: hypothetical protein FD171_1170 [Actinomycetota bacterium]MDP3630154.1 hypothetical protein [Actinomycetota bacterium]